MWFEKCPKVGHHWSGFVWQMFQSVIDTRILFRHTHRPFVCMPSMLMATIVTTKLYLRRTLDLRIFLVLLFSFGVAFGIYDVRMPMEMNVWPQIKPTHNSMCCACFCVYEKWHICYFNKNHFRFNRLTFTNGKCMTIHLITYGY